MMRGGVVGTCSLLMTLLLTSGVCQQGQDHTREEETKGSDVVDAVIDMIRRHCIFSDDRLFLRRVAFVETLDGTDPSTYSPYYHGGIWKVDADMFQQVHPCPSATPNECSLIKSELSIDWSSVTWSDLRKPLYSGLAAALYMLLKMRVNNELAVPGEISQQAAMWARFYRRDANPDLFTALAANATSFNCQGKMDVVFVLDGSGSVGSSHFTLMLQFVTAVTDALSVAEDGARVSLVLYSTNANVEFPLNRYTTNSDVRKAILDTSYPGGWTYTDKALDLTRTRVFSTNHGAREAVKKVVVLLTDGRSNSYAGTVTAARRLKEDVPSVLFTIGVGGYSLAELEACATEPVCSHIFTLDRFSYINSIRYEIQKSTCEARTILPPGSEGPGVEENIPAGGNSTTDVESGKPEEDEHIEVEVDCGEVDVYLSYTNYNPSSAVYDEHHRALHQRPARLYLSTLQPKDHVYMRLIGQRVSDQEARRLNCSGYNFTVSVKPNPEPTTAGPTSSPVDNPCTPENIRAGRFYFAYGPDRTKFIQCTPDGRYFIMPCAPGTEWEQVLQTCA